MNSRYVLPLQLTFFVPDKPSKLLYVVGDDPVIEGLSMIWTLIEALHKDFSSVEGTMHLNQLGQPPRNHAPQPARSTTKEPCTSTS